VAYHQNQFHLNVIVILLPACRRRYDVTFALDASGSAKGYFDQAQQFTKHVVMGLNFNGGRTRVAVVTYSDEAEVRFG
jgi:hypothetical protein